jgi:hypothetical protein
MTTDNVEHTVNMETVVQIVSQSGGAKQVQMTNGEKFIIGAPEWTAKMHEQIQRSRGVS